MLISYHPSSSQNGLPRLLPNLITSNELIQSEPPSIHLVSTVFALLIFSNQVEEKSGDSTVNRLVVSHVHRINSTSNYSTPWLYPSPSPSITNQYLLCQSCLCNPGIEACVFDFFFLLTVDIAKI